MNRCSLLPIAALLAAALPVSAASGCDAVVAAGIKVLQVPAHLYITETGGGPEIRRPSISTAPPNVRIEGQFGTCTVLRDEAVGGEPATLYKVHNKSEDAVDAQIWVSKLRGLPLKQSYDLDRSHTEIRYEYTNVTAPTVSESKRK
jgi:hypothetical protein